MKRKKKIIKEQLKDTKASRKTHPPASTNHGRLGLILDQSKLFTTMLQKNCICYSSSVRLNMETCDGMSKYYLRQ